MNANNHIVIGRDKNIKVPEELIKIAVQHDHNVKTVVFDCPRYWDGNDLSQMTIYINYIRADLKTGQAKAENIMVDNEDENIIHFGWKITNNVSCVHGKIHFLVCAKSVNNNGELQIHWNSELNKEMCVSEGLECGEMLLEQYPDVITQILLDLKDVEKIYECQTHDLTMLINDYMKEKALNTMNTKVGDDYNSISIIREGAYALNGAGCFMCKTKVCAGDNVEFKNTWVMSIRQNYSDRVVITNKDLIVVKTISFLELNQNPSIIIEEDGYLYLSSEYYDTTDVLFVIFRKNSVLPLVLNEDETTMFETNTAYGDDVLHAILSGRQILVKVQNRHGGTLYRNFMPVLQYQLPNVENDYLTLFYLRDGIDENIMSAFATGSFDVVYGELTIKLSKTYNKCPLEV